MINVTSNIKAMLTTDGTLPAYAWPGGYPLMYADTDGMVLCVTCANENDEFNAPISEHGINWEDKDFTCDHCSKLIEVAYE
jgi:hypothetical protein